METHKERYFDVPALSNSYITGLSGGYKPKNLKDIFLFGSMFHYLILEPEKFDRGLCIEREWTHQLDSMYNSFSKSKLEEVDIFKSLPQVEYEFYRKINGLWCKIKTDKRGGNIIGELKSTSATSQKQFMGNYYRFGYHRAASFYLDVSKTSTVHLVVAISKVNYEIFTHVTITGDKNYQRGKGEYQAIIDSHILSNPDEVKRFTSGFLEYKRSLHA